jgi:hypothetical protein
MKIKNVNRTGLNAIGSSYVGTIVTTKNKLSAVLGEPVAKYKDPENDGKVNFEWIIQLDNGDVVTVYDWKEEYIVYGDTEIEWHIGSKKSNYESFRKLLEDLIENTEEKENQICFDCIMEVEMQWRYFGYKSENKHRQSCEKGKRNE